MDAENANNSNNLNDASVSAAVPVTGPDPSQNPVPTATVGTQVSAPSAPAAEPQSASSASPNPISTTPTPVPAQSASAPKINFLAFIIAFLRKPVTTIREEIPKFANFKNAGILTAIVAGIATLTTLLSTIYATVHVKSCTSFIGGNCKTSWKWENLKDANLFGSSISIFIGIVVGLALLTLLFFVASRLMKKTNTSFLRMLSIAAISSLPSILAMFLAMLLSKINFSIGLGIVVMGYTYSMYIFYEAINNEVGLIDNDRIKLFMISALICAVSLVVILLGFSNALKKIGLDLDDMNIPGLNGSSLPSLKKTKPSSNPYNYLKYLD